MAFISVSVILEKVKEQSNIGFSKGENEIIEKAVKMLINSDDISTVRTYIDENDEVILDRSVLKMKNRDSYIIDMGTSDFSCYVDLVKNKYQQS